MAGTKYPNKIDGAAQLPLLSDLISPIQADDVNRLRNAIVAIQTELGINPSGTFGTVKDRLDALEAATFDGYTTVNASTVLIEDADGYFVSTNVEDALAEIINLINNLTAADISILDADGYYTGTNVEDALAEIGAGGIGGGPVAAADVSIADIDGYFVSSNVEDALAELGAKTEILDNPALTDDFIGLFFESPTDKVYHFAIDVPIDGYIIEVTTQADSGTGTGTVAINGVPLGGSTNSISSSKESQTHSTNNRFLPGDDLTFEVSSSASLVDLRVGINFRKTGLFVGGGSGDGYIVGPGSSTDNAIVRWDGYGGTQLQNSNVLIDDSDNITGVNNLTASSATFDGNLPTLLSNVASAATPSSGFGSIYPKPDGYIYFKNSSGTEFNLTEGGESGVIPGLETLTYAATVDIDFSTSLPTNKELTLSGDVTFTTSGLEEGRAAVIRVIGDSSNRSLNFPAGWTFLGGDAPAELEANDFAILSLVSYSTVDSSVVAAYATNNTRVLDGYGTDGYISYWSDANTLTRDLVNVFYWDELNGSLGIGTDTPASKLQVDGSIAHGVIAVSSNTVLNTSHCTVFVTTGASTITITLPTASSAPGRRYEIKKIDAGAGPVSVDRSGSDLIDGATSQSLTSQYQSITLVSDGSANWFIV